MFNETKISRSLIIGAMLVAATRYVGVFAHSEGWMIAGDVWQWLVALSGLGMAILEGIAVWYCWQAWSNAQPNTERNFLMCLIVAMFVTLGVMVAPYTYAASHKKLTVDALNDWLQVLWSVAVSVAPLIVMAAAGLAEKLLPVSTQDAQGEADSTALVSQAVAGAMDALKPEFERVAGMSAATATEVARMQREVARQVSETQRQVALVAVEVSELRNKPKLERVQVASVAQLSAGETWQAKALSLARNQIETGVQPNYTEIAQAVGKSRTAVAAAVKAQLP